MSRKDDLRVGEILGYTFWEERRGDYHLHLVYSPGELPWDSTRDKQSVKDRCKQLALSEFGSSSWLGVNQSWYPHFTTDPAADYQAMDWARNNLEGLNEIEFDTALEEIMCSSDREGTTRLFPYLPGDYSRALLALKEKGLL